MNTYVAVFSPSRRHAYRMLVLTELRLAWRTPSYLVVALGIPVLLVVIFGSIPSLTQPEKEFDGVSFFTIYTPTLMVLVLIVLGLLSLPSQMGGYREKGVLHRMSTTPVPASALLGAQVAVNVLFVVVSFALILGVGAGAFNLVLPVQFGWLVLSLALAVAAMFGIGLCIAAFASSARVALVIAGLLFYPLAFFCGYVRPADGVPRRGETNRKVGAHWCWVLRPPSLAWGTLSRLDDGRSPRRLRSCVQRDRRPLVPLGRRAIPRPEWEGPIASHAHAQHHSARRCHRRAGDAGAGRRPAVSLRGGAGHKVQGSVVRVRHGAGRT